MEVSVYVVRAFLKLRELVATHQGLSKRLDALAMQHDTLSRNTRAQLKQVMDALRELMASAQSPAPPKRPIGFVHPQDATKPKPTSAKVATAKAAPKK